MNELLVYLLVASAIVMPVMLWRKDNETSSDLTRMRESGWQNLPGMFKHLWGMTLLLEASVGSVVAKMTAGGFAEFEKLRLASSLPVNYARMGALKVLCTFVFGAVGAVFTMLPGFEKTYGFAILSVCMIFGWIYPSMALKQYVEWRKTELTRALPFAIDLMGSAMRAGLEFGAAMRYFVGLGTGGPIQEDFSSVLSQMELGKTRSEALTEMAQRVQIESFTSFVGVVVYGTEIGASIVDTLKMQGEDLRRARFNIAERKAARAPSLMILPMALFIMPAVFIIIITPVVMQMQATGVGAH